MCALQAAAAALPELAMALAAEDREAELMVRVLVLAGLWYTCLWSFAQSSSTLLHAIRGMPRSAQHLISLPCDAASGKHAIVSCREVQLRCQSCQ